MKKLTYAFLSVFLVMFTQVNAQTPDDFYVGLGYSVPTRILAQFGYDSNAFGAGLATRGSVQFAVGASGFVALGDAMYKSRSGSFAPYIGGGAGVITVFTRFGSLTGFEVHATGGGELFVSEEFAFFAELQPFLLVSPGSYFDVRLNLGANYHF